MLNKMVFDGYISIELFIFILTILVVLIIILFILYLKNARARKILSSDINKQAADLTLQVDLAKNAAKAKSDFLSQMSHEIRTPMNAIIGMVQIARNSPNVLTVRDCMDKIEGSSKHLLGIINDILDFSKIESGKLVFENKLFSISGNIGFVHAMFKTQAEEKKINLAVQLRNIAHDGIVADSLRLNQVLINLLSNALKFTPENGTVILRVEEVDHIRDESVYRFMVIDTGIGITPGDAKKLFTPFSQANSEVSRKYGGTGLGLAISNNLVAMMGGEFELDTKPGEGSAFSFTIRAPSSEKAEDEVWKIEALKNRRSFGGKRVLVVDDIEINREILLGLLESTGLDMETAENGKEAFDKFQTSEPGYYDLIFMDMQMPVMDGCASTIEIRNCPREDSRTVKIISLSANVFREDFNRAMESGMDGYLTKPVELDKLLDGLEKWL